jgi:hypothetical protein
MTYEEIYQALESTGLPVTYEIWENGSIPPLPYIVFTYPGNNDFIADDVNYATIVRLEVGLYTKRKSIAVERNVEQVLNEKLGPFFKTSDYVSADSMQETLYTMEVAINA